MDLNRLLPQIVLAAIGWHSKGAFQKRLATVTEMQHSMIVETDMGSILRQAKLAAIEDPNFTISNLKAFISHHMDRGLNGTDPGVDPWGRPYRHDLHSGRLTIKCAGPDTRWGTDDDIERSDSIF